MIFQDMNLPKKSKLNKTIFKNNIYENAGLNKQEKDLIKNDIEKIVWEYSLKENTINISAYSDYEVEYIEVEFITITLKEKKHYKKVFEIFQKCIPYPLVLVAEFENSFFINVAMKRINKNDPSKITIEEIISTEEINIDNIPENYYNLVDKIEISKLPFSNFYEFYKKIYQNLVAYNISEITGKQEEPNKENSEKLKKLKDIQLKLETLKNQMNKEKQTARRSEILKEVISLTEKLDKYK